MKILAIEFSSDQRSVAVVTAGNVLGEAVESATRATPTFSLIHRTLAQAGLEREAVECLAIGLGPGSYTGIRLAIAVAQGWQLAVGGLKLLGISSVACLAAEAQERGWFGKVNIVIDAQRNELYLAGYEISATQCREIQPLKLATIEEAREQMASGEIVIGPEVNRWFESGKIIAPSAATLGRIASRTAQRAVPTASSCGEFIDGEKLEPIYLRETNFVKAPPLRKLPSD